MKKFLLILLAVIIADTLPAQNTLDRAGLGASAPAAAAYSLRLLSTGYAGAAIQVRRSSDNALQDIGFTVSGHLDTTALRLFTGAGDGFVQTWYDQSGNARHMTKLNTAMQPQIVFNAVFKYIGSRVAMDFNVNRGLVYSGSLTVASMCAIVRSELPVWPNHHAMLDGSPRIGGLLYANGNSFWPDAIPPQVWKNGVPKTWSESLSPVNEGMILGVTTLTHGISQLYAGNFDGAANGGSVLETEAIAFASLLTAGDRKALECNEGLYYGIVTSCNTVINTQPNPSGFAACMGSTATQLPVDATGVGLTYQWFSNSSPVNSGGSAVSGATGNSFSPSTAALGTSYYYAEVYSSIVPALTSNISGPIIVDAAPVVSISPAAVTIHTGEPVSLVASGASSYSWGTDNATPLDHAAGYRMAVGLRKLKSSYNGAALRLRRGSDNAEADFAFAGNDLDIAAISSFLGAANGYCTILYDQAGFGNNMTQTDPSQQPLFVATGLNGRPVLHYNTSQGMYNSTNFAPPFSVIYAAKQTGGSRQRVLTCSNNWLLGWWGGDKGKAHFDGWITPSGGSPADNNPYVYSGTGTGAISSIYENGALLSSNSGGLTGPNSPAFNGNERSDVDVTELFIFNSVLSDADREAVENSTGSYYAVFGSPPVPGANLLVSPTVTTTYHVTGYSENGGCAVQQDVVVTVLNNPGLSGFPAQVKLYYDSAYSMPAPVSSSSGGFTYTSSNPAVAVIIGSQVIITGTGVTNITAVQAADAGYFADSISTTLTVTSVEVVSANGSVGSANYQYVNKYGELAGRTGVNANGASLITKSGNNGLSPATASSSAYQIKQDYPASTDGLYWITNANINGGIPVQIYADMTTDGGGWTLILCNKSPNPGWNNSNALLRNENSPDPNATYSIIGWADHIKKSSSGFQYMMDAQNRRSNGGIWTANASYSFVSTSNNNMDITLNTKFGTWNYSGSDIEPRMPWYSPGSQGLITTSIDANGDWWGTLIASGGWDPAPWLGSSVESPGVIWYWVR